MSKTNKVFNFVLLIVIIVIMSVACNSEKESKVTNAIQEDPNNVISDEGNETDQSQEDILEDKNEIGTNSTTNTKETNGLELNIAKLEKVELTPKEELREIRDITSIELIKEMKIGWNLGNTLDSTGGKGIKSETSWGNPVTSKKMIDMVKEAGFNILRIPTTWENHLGPAPDYKIDAAWMNRVKEVVDYGVENEMFIILNIHHEEWHFPSNDNYENAKHILVKVWTQIADAFDYYDEFLIFEGMNEPRMKGTNNEWNGGTPEGREVVSKLNIDFFNTIRNSGGNNSKRHLMIPTYAASSDRNTWGDLVVPEDNKVIVSLHAYTPYNFALNAEGTDLWSNDNENDKREIDSLMLNIKSHFIDNGIPAILGEFGARNKDNLESRISWANYYVKKAKEVGIPCIWWDNGAFEGSGENFGLLNRRDQVWIYPEIIQSLMDGVK